MTGYLIYPSTTPRGNNAFDWWKQAAARYGVQLQVFFYENDGMSTELASLPMPDFVILRGYNTALSQWYEQRGVRVVNPSWAMLLCRDKLSTVQTLTKAGVSTPKTFTASDTDNTYAGACKALEASKFILKQNFGSKGENVFLIASEDDYSEAVRICKDEETKRLEALDRTGLASEFGQTREEVLRGSTILVQQYIESSFGRDIRVWICAGQVIGHILRYNDSSFKSNFAAGGSYRDIELPKAGADLAIAASAAIGLDFAGIDLLYTSDEGFTVCEVNGNAGFRTASADIPDGIFRTLFR